MALHEQSGRAQAAIVIINRSDARALGLTQYFTGEPCCHGHVTARCVSNQRCLGCMRAYAKSHTIENREKIRVWQAAYRQAHKPPPKPPRPRMSREEQLRRQRESNKRRRAAGLVKRSPIDPAKKKEQQHRSYLRRRETIKATVAQWRLANPDHWRRLRRAAARNWRARLKQAEGSHSGADIAAILKAQSGRCAYCRKRLPKSGYHVDHITPLKAGGSNDRRNLQITCQPCNQRKSAKDPIQFAQQIGMLL